MTPENNKPDTSGDDDKTITEVGRELLKYLHRRANELGVNQASYRQARMELLRTFEGEAGGKFNWGFETVFTQEIHVLEDLGLISVKYGSGAIMAGKGKPNQIYNVALTDDGKDTARIIVDREERIRSETAKLDKSEQAAATDEEEEEDEGDDTDKSDKTDDISTRAAPPPEDRPTSPPQELPGDRFAKD